MPHQYSPMYVNARALVERRTDQGPALLIQTRNRPDEDRTCIELPGGRVEGFESLLDALRREVLEETGLEVTHIEGQDLRLTIQTRETCVECVAPFAAYQTTQGPVDSMGLYFRCRAEGELLAEGDFTKDIRWIAVDELARMLRDQTEAFCWLDRCGMTFYLRQAHGIVLAGESD